LLLSFIESVTAGGSHKKKRIFSQFLDVIIKVNDGIKVARITMDRIVILTAFWYLDFASYNLG